jgi:hypothetical protein
VSFPAEGQVALGAAEYRALAQEMRDKADATRDAEARMALRSIAFQYARLAEQAEKRERESKKP